MFSFTLGCQRASEIHRLEPLEGYFRCAREGWSYTIDTLEATKIDRIIQRPLGRAIWGEAPGRGEIIRYATTTPISIDLQMYPHGSLHAHVQYIPANILRLCSTSTVLLINPPANSAVHWSRVFLVANTPPLQLQSNDAGRRSPLSRVGWLRVCLQNDKIKMKEGRNATIERNERTTIDHSFTSNVRRARQRIKKQEPSTASSPTRLS